MSNPLKVLHLAGACALALALLSSPARADAVITSGPFSVGVASNGDLYTFGSGIGFLRNSDGYDPLAPGSPRDSWGVSAGAVGGYADQADFGTSRIVPNGSPVYTSNSAFVSSFLNNGSNLLRIDQTYTFAANNIVQVATSVTNVSGSAQSVLFQRNVDWDVAPTEFNEVTHVPAGPPSPVSNDSYYGFENPDPTVPYAFSAYPGGGTFGPGDLGGGIAINLGTLGAGATASFNYFYGITQTGQHEDGLISELQGLGANFVVSTESSEGGTGIGDGANAAAIAVSPAVITPEPTSLSLLGLGLLGVAGYRQLRRKAAQ